MRVGILRAWKHRNGAWGDIGALAFTSVVPSATTASVVRKLIRGRRSTRPPISIAGYLFKE